MSTRADRSRLQARIFPLGHEPAEDLSDTTTPSERLAMVWDLSREAWALTGLPVPNYERHQIPITMVALSSRRDESGL
jgi:hypothetical protein